MSPLALQRVPRLSGGLAIGIGFLVLTGWTLDSGVLKGAGGSITMKPNAAIGLIACGLSLFLAARRDSSGKQLARASAAFAGTVGILTLTEHFTGWNLHIDELLFVEPPGAAATASPGRMGINSSLSMSMTAFALWALHAGTRRAASLSQHLALGVASLATIALVGYAYGTRELYALSRYTGIAWPTAVTWLVLAGGILFARPSAPPIATILSKGPGGIIARRALLPAVLVPLVLGYLVVLGLEMLLYDAELAAALLAVSVVGVLGVMIWRTAVRVDEADRARERARQERDDLLVLEHAAREQAERANRLKDEFLAALSHELRTPLNTVLGWIEMMRDNAVQPEQRDHAIDVASRNGKILARLIEDLLDVSRIETGQLRLDVERVDLAHVAAAAAEAVAPEAAAKGIQLISNVKAGSAFVVGDSDRLQQIVRNLLANAIKFTPAGGAIEMAIEIRPTAVQLTVTDTGKGITPAFVPHVFERFRQEDGTPTREHGGLGLGLSIVRELAELHGGSVEAFSEGAGRGSRFTLTLPAPPDSAHTPASTSADYAE